MGQMKTGFLILVITLVLFELSLRIMASFEGAAKYFPFVSFIRDTGFPHGVRLVRNDPMYQMLEDEVLQYELVPGSKRTGVTINSLGFRGAETTLQPAVDVTRIAVVGDSETFCPSLPDSATFPVQLEQALNNMGSGRRYETLNLGVPGYNVAQEHRYLELKVLPLQPSFVLLRYVFNDPAVGNPHLMLDTGFLGNFHTYLALKFVFRPVTPLEKLFSGFEESPAGFYLKIHQDRYWDVTRRLLRSMAAKCRERGIGFAVLVDPEVYSGKLHDDYPYEEIHSRLAAAAEGHFPLIEVLPLLQRRYGNARELWVGPRDAHKNAGANMIMARHAAARLTELLKTQ
jgi:hypothetical protein